MQYTHFLEKPVPGYPREGGSPEFLTKEQAIELLAADPLADIELGRRNLATIRAGKDWMPVKVWDAVVCSWVSPEDRLPQPPPRPNPYPKYTGKAHQKRKAA